MSSVELKYEAAKVLLDTMTTVMMESVDRKTFIQNALKHRELFIHATANSPALYDAGMEVAGELKEMA